MLTQLEVPNNNLLELKLQKLEPLFTSKRILVAFSGGVDSTVTAYLAKRYASSVVLVMQVGLSVGIGEKEFALKQAQELDLPIKFLEYDEVDYSSAYAQNPHNRCYYCKELLYGFMSQLLGKMNYDLIVSGTNLSDLKGHRPGHQAAIEASVVNPLVEAKLTKQDVRWIARKANLAAWDKPATACLASRFMTGTPITKEGLTRVAQAEDYIKTKFKVRILRVRDQHQHARIEVGVNELNKVLASHAFGEIESRLRQLGFLSVSLDMKGYRPSTPSKK